MFSMFLYFYNWFILFNSLNFKFTSKKYFWIMLACGMNNVCCFWEILTEINAFVWLKNIKLQWFRYTVVKFILNLAVFVKLGVFSDECYSIRAYNNGKKKENLIYILILNNKLYILVIKNMVEYILHPIY